MSVHEECDSNSDIAVMQAQSWTYQGGFNSSGSVVAGVVSQGNNYVAEGGSLVINVGSSNNLQQVLNRRQPISVDQKQQILDWLSPLSFNQKQGELFAKRHKNTGQWIQQDKIYQQWRDGKENITLWCPGNPGVGKTFLVSIIVNSLTDYSIEKKYGVAYLYCDYLVREMQTAKNLISSLTSQLADLYYQYHTKLPEEVLESYEMYIKEKKCLLLEDCVLLLLSVAKRFGKVFVVIDALDECSECFGPERHNERFIAALQKLRPSVRLLVTSRYHTSIETHFVDARRVEIGENIADIKIYLESQMEKRSIHNTAIFSKPELNETIVSTITKMCGGIFLLAKLQIDHLATKTNTRDVRIALGKLPTDLKKTYRDAIDRIDAQPREYAKLAKDVLMWVLFAKRPLCIEELQHALSTRDGDVSIDEEGFHSTRFLTGVCMGLVSLDSKSRIVRLVHLTLHEYLEENKHLFPAAELKIARTCLTYLSFDIFNEGYWKSDDELSARLQRFRFLTYAARYWGNHISGDTDKEVQAQVIKFLKSGPKLTCCSQVMHLPKYRFSGYSLAFPERVTGLQIAASFGLAQVVKELVKKGADVNAADSYKQTSLHRAARGGHKAVVELLFNKGACVDAKDRHSRTALHEAVVDGHNEVARLLLEGGADFKAKDGNKQTALHLAASGGHKALVKLLIKMGAEVDAQDNNKRTALHEAAKDGHKAVVKLLVKKGATVDALDYYERTALHEAAGWGHEAVVRILIDKKADFNVHDKYKWTALHRAAESGHEEVVRLLLEENAKVEEQDGVRQTALCRAAMGGHDAVVQLLLAYGANVKVMDTNERTPLHHAASGGYDRVVELLLGHGAFINADDSNSGTALHRAAEMGHEAVVRLLLAKGVNVNAKDKYQWTALRAAIAGKHRGVVQLLLDANADIDGNDKAVVKLLHGVKQA